mgnify:CR=1 FL=1
MLSRLSGLGKLGKLAKLRKLRLGSCAALARSLGVLQLAGCSALACVCNVAAFRLPMRSVTSSK